MHHKHLDQWTEILDRKTHSAKVRDGTIMLGKSQKKGLLTRRSGEKRAFPPFHTRGKRGVGGTQTNPEKKGILFKDQAVEHVVHRPKGRRRKRKLLLSSVGGNAETGTMRGEDAKASAVSAGRPGSLGLSWPDKVGGHYS